MVVISLFVNNHTVLKFDTIFQMHGRAFCCPSPLQILLTMTKATIALRVRLVGLLVLLKVFAEGFDFPRIYNAVVPQPASYEDLNITDTDLCFAAQVDFLGVSERGLSFGGVGQGADFMRIEFLVHSSFELDLLTDLITDPICAHDLTIDEVKTKALHLEYSHGEESRHSSDRNLQEFETIPGFDCYKNLKGSFDWVDSIVKQAAATPGLSIDRIDIGDSFLRTIDVFDGYDMWALNITGTGTATPSAEKGLVFIISGIHAREFTPPELVSRWVDDLVNSYGIDADKTSLLDHTELHIILQANPDGRFVAEDNLSDFRRKNMNGDESQCEPGASGVDLNRNFPFMWGLDTGSSDNPCTQNYRGRSPASEPEVQAIIEYARLVFPEEQRKDDIEIAYPDTIRGAFIDIHSYGDVLIWPFGFENRVTPNENQYQAILGKMSEFNGYGFSGPGPDYLYAASGATDDWAYSTLGAAAFTFELGNEFYEDCDYFLQSILEQNMAALTYVATISSAPFRLGQGPDITALTLTADGNVVIIEATASDSALSSTGDPSSQQNLQSIEVFMDQHPDVLVNGEAPVGMVMSGDYQVSPAGNGVYEFNTDALSVGRHTAYVRAIDSTGYEGPVRAIWFETDRASVETAAPITITNSPISAPTVAPVEPVSPTDAPIAPIAPTDTPVETAAPIATTNSPISPANAPIAPIPLTDAPIETAAPIATTAAPISPTDAPVVPVSPTDAPIVPVSPTDAPVVASTTAPIASTTSTDPPVAPSSNLFGECEDDATARFRVSPLITPVGCDWLGQIENAVFKRIFCVEGGTPHTACRRTCASCEGAPTDSPVPATIKPTASPTVSVSSLAPDFGICEDNNDEPFQAFYFVSQTCGWLRQNQSRWKRFLCKEGAPAWDHCPATCGKCQAE